MWTTDEAVGQSSVDLWFRPKYWFYDVSRHEGNMAFLYLNSGLTCLPMLGVDNKMTSSSRTKWRLFSASTCNERSLLFYFYTTKSSRTIIWMKTKSPTFTGQLIILFCKSWRNFSLSRRSLYCRRTKAYQATTVNKINIWLSWNGFQQMS